MDRFNVDAFNNSTSCGRFEIRSQTTLHGKYGTPIFPLSQTKKKARLSTNTAGTFGAPSLLSGSPPFFAALC
jgi:hypothetical protein